MMLDSRGAGAPLFRRIADTLADAIGRGDYPVGGRLPTELALGRMFGAGRFTIREALAELRSRGMVVSRRGSGTMVMRNAPQAEAFGESYRSIGAFLASVEQAPFAALDIRDVIADDALAAVLRCEPGRQFLLLHGVRRSRDRPDQPPMALVDMYINSRYGAIRPHLTALSESMADTAEKLFGVRMQSLVQELEPMVLDAEQADALSASIGGAAMLVRRWGLLGDGTQFLISRSVYPQGRMLFRTELRRGPAPED